MGSKGLCILQLITSIAILYYFYVECDKFYCLITGRKGITHLKEDVAKLWALSYQETAEMGMGTVSLSIVPLFHIMSRKILTKIHQHFVQSITLFAQKAVVKYTENFIDICASSWKPSTQTLMGQDTGGWYGYMESVIRVLMRPTEMGYCFLDSNRIFNSFMSMEMEKYFLRCKVNLVTISTSALMGIPMFYRALRHIIMDAENQSSKSELYKSPSTTSFTIPPPLSPSFSLSSQQNKKKKKRENRGEESPPPVVEMRKKRKSKKPK